ncbi:DUF2291 family protein [Pelosinus sp. sgz500959]|uniref:DUF2291 family protein n=1 Tax=Pelosinus sp. sgz500959 TaxID=3242472 RepID=UPI003671D99D
MNKMIEPICIRKVNRTLFIVLCLFSAILFSGCKLYTVVPNDKTKDSQQGTVFYFQDENFDANQFVDSVWDSKVIPAINQKASDMSIVIQATKTDVDEAGKKYGIRSAQEGSPWNFIVKGKGRVLNVNTESRAGTIDIDLAPYDGKADFKIQIGPVIKGTAVRDSFDFIKYDDFKNQMVFAELSNAFHKKIASNLLAKTDFLGNKGKEVNFIGVFTFMPSQEILVTPISMEFKDGDKS